MIEFSYPTGRSLNRRTVRATEKRASRVVTEIEAPDGGRSQNSGLLTTYQARS